MMYKSVFFSLLLLSLLSIGCNNSNNPQPTNSPQPNTTSSPQPNATSSPEANSTNEPTPQPSTTPDLSKSDLTSKLPPQLAGKLTPEQLKQIEEYKKNPQAYINNRTAPVNFARQAKAINDRLRLFGEELKTSHSPEQQKALMENVRQTIKPSYDLMSNLNSQTPLPKPELAKAMLNACSKLDKALATGDPKTLQPVLEEFNSAYNSLKDEFLR